MQLKVGWKLTRRRGDAKEEFSTTSAIDSPFSGVFRGGTPSVFHPLSAISASPRANLTASIRLSRIHEVDFARGGAESAESAERGWKPEVVGPSQAALPERALTTPSPDVAGGHGSVILFILQDPRPYANRRRSSGHPLDLGA